jgi:peptide/nickel transport system substrate-binding protein
MEGEQQSTPAPPQRWVGRRGASTGAAAAILIVVIVVVGAGGYFGLNAAAPSGTAGQTTTSSPPPTCQPANSNYCKHINISTAVNDVVLTVPYQAGFDQNIGSVAQGTLVPASLTVTGGESVNSWSVAWGDGTTNTSTSPLLTHVYNTLGVYAISGTATVGSKVHTGTGYLFPIEVTPSIQTNTAGTYPTLTATLANGTTAAFQEPWVKLGGTFTVNATYTGEPSNTAWLTAATSLIVSGGSASGTLTTTSAAGDTAGVAGTFTAANPGVYAITMVGPIKNVLSGVTVYQNYTWGVYVSPTNNAPGCTSCAKAPNNLGEKDPHPGTIDSYEVVPGGATSIDPSVDYESVGYEVIANIYQTLVYYNGSSSASFLPELATCVPGSAACQTAYGSSLIVNNKTTGLPEYWTFVIDKNANFYDPAHHAAWGVYPTDVMTSIARTAAFSIQPFFAANPGWIQTQALLAFLGGNPAWDNGLHFVFNNTGANVLSTMLINDSSYCPAAAMTSEHGCITFNAWGGGADWPFFLELVSDPDGGGIQPCGWFGHQVAGVPGFNTTLPNGDGPCLLPSTGTTAQRETTNNSQWASYIASITPQTSTGFKAWDNFEEAGALTPNVFPDVRFNGVGSGPYYLASLTRGVGYVLEANPGYGQPGCAGAYWCEPAPSNYATTVNVFWEPTDQVGIQEYIQGQADFAGIQSQDIATLLNLEATGKLGITNAPTISVFFDPINMEVNLKQVNQYYTGAVHLPSDTGAGTASDFFSYVALRQFLVNSFPYTQDVQQVLTIDGIQLGFNYGGAIPKFMGNYYPTNVTWPAGQPDTNPNDVGGAAWWWAQATNSASPYYDPLLAQCTTSNPCTFPVGGEQGDTPQNSQFPIWSQWLSSLSGGRLAFTEVDLTFSQLVVYTESSTPYTNPVPVYVLGWLPDYPDPTDYTTPMYLPDATYTGPGAVFEALKNDTSTTDAACPAADQVGSSATGFVNGNFASFAFWANLKTGGILGIPQDCQGWAYNAMTWATVQAGAMPVGPLRTLYYNMLSHIANDLALYIYQFQEQLVGSNAPWISPNSINTNVVLGGDGLFYEIQGNGLVA